MNACHHRCSLVAEIIKTAFLTLLITALWPTNVLGQNSVLANEGSRLEVTSFVPEEIRLVVTTSAEIDVTVRIAETGAIVHEGTADENNTWLADTDAATQPFLDADLTSNILYKLTFEVVGGSTFDYLYFHCESGY